MLAGGLRSQIDNLPGIIGQLQKQTGVKRHAAAAPR